jgi:hypothetical protein
MIQKASQQEINQNLYTLNDETNRRIHQIVDEFNSMGNDCEDDLEHLSGKSSGFFSSEKKKSMPKIYKQIKDALGGGIIFGAMETWSEETDAIKKYGDGNNIYKEEPGMFDFPLQQAFNLDGHVVGPDKLGHFVDQGFDLYSNFIAGETQKAGFDAAMEQSDYLEEVIYGLSASGVKSYGDMAANFSGMKFWHNLTGQPNSYLKCNEDSGKYEVNRDFDWAEFADDSWDQGINCSTFTSTTNPYEHGQYKNKKSLYGTETDRILKKYLAGVDKSLACPDDLKKCQQISKMPCSKYFVSPKCLDAANTKLTCDKTNFDKLLEVADNGSYKYDRKPASGSSSGGARDI